jgi:hypothetical protein
MASNTPPQVPSHIELWSTRALADWLGVSISTVKYHARQAFRTHNGRWELTRQQAQAVVNRIYYFGQSRTLRQPHGSSPELSKNAD